MVGNDIDCSQGRGGSCFRPLFYSGRPKQDQPDVSVFTKVLQRGVRRGDPAGSDGPECPGNVSVKSNFGKDCVTAENLSCAAKPSDPPGASAEPDRLDYIPSVPVHHAWTVRV